MWNSKARTEKNSARSYCEEPNRKNAWIAFRWIERASLTCGLSLLAVVGALRIESWLSSRAAVKEFATHGALAPYRTQGAENHRIPLDTELSSKEREGAHMQSEMTAKSAGGPIAVLRIPRIQLEAPVFDGTDALTLNHAAGRIPGTARPGEQGNIGIAAHRDSFFRGLKDIEIGDAIQLRREGGTDTYVVDDLQIVRPDNVEILRRRSHPSLTLVTCFPFYYVGSAPERYIVMASLIQGAKGGSDISTQIPKPQQAAQQGETMKNLNAIPRLFGSSAAYGLVFAMASIGALAQDTTKLSVKDGVSTYTTEVRDAEVVYVQGNNLVLKLEDGKVEHLVVPDSDKFTIGSKEVSVNELQPGTTLTQTIVTSTTPRYVNTVRTIKGKVWHATPTGRVIVTLPDGTNQVYQIPGDAKVNVKGKPQRAFGLRKGMTFEATIVSDDSHSVIERSKSVVGEIPTPATPHLLGFLVIQQPAVSFEPTQAVETEASAEKLPAELPKTGTMQPLAGVIGALALLSSLGLGFARRKFTV